MMDMKMMSPRKRMDMEGSGVTVKMAKGGMAKKGYAAGGVTRADGIAVKGHTKGKMV
jgi:hypothetical protein